MPSGSDKSQLRKAEHTNRLDIRPESTNENDHRVIRLENTLYKPLMLVLSVSIIAMHL